MQASELAALVNTEHMVEVVKVKNFVLILIFVSLVKHLNTTK